MQKFMQGSQGKIVDVPPLAAQAGLKDRTFLRRFQKGDRPHDDGLLAALAHIERESEAA
ncbi:hypothetical protein [Sphingomonas sp. CFBP 13603]|uniref:hypothetical protein n=1 Tax=Sphingomonas sp. CFBP 13603 TaxID=2774040 RepID=UPI0018D88B13|nr:hypothetical protein [Sphingomonas sp. CFBP 13603]